MKLMLALSIAAVAGCQRKPKLWTLSIWKHDKPYAIFTHIPALELCENAGRFAITDAKKNFTTVWDESIQYACSEESR